MTVKALEPPSTSPLLYTSKHPPNSGKFSVQVNIGDTLDVTCVVDGGQPAVTSVTMTCFSNTTTVAGNSLTMRIAIDVITIHFSCTCQAAHVTNCYYLKSQMFFTENLESLENTETDVGLAVGLGVGGVVVVVVAVVVVVVVLRKRSSPAKRPPTPPSVHSDSAGSETNGGSHGYLTFDDYYKGSNSSAYDMPAGSI
ncbi:uncharacterized protein LOC131939593 [Physella acuta]|uniref:uncharacterized protein LOC131939593 n=1 Tax=Physella acuta TaxID=109671 RepID=UPI0027DC3695|nr:uncharacterized protein LOC131939593 [Physella acuta]